MNIIDANARDLMAITPNDSALLPKTVCSIYVGGTGALIVVTQAEWERQVDVAAEPIVVATVLAACTKVTLSSVPVGFVLNANIAAVMSTGTTASLLVGYLP